MEYLDRANMRIRTARYTTFLSRLNRDIRQSVIRKSPGTGYFLGCDPLTPPGSHALSTGSAESIVVIVASKEMELSIEFRVVH